MMVFLAIHEFFLVVCCEIMYTVTMVAVIIQYKRGGHGLGSKHVNMSSSVKNTMVNSVGKRISPAHA